MVYGPELFEKLEPGYAETYCTSQKRKPSKGGFWLRLRKNGAAVIGLTVITALTLLAVFGPMISGYSYDEQNLAQINQSPGLEHWFGTDSLGRDLFTRIWYGARISMSIGLATSMICLIIGVGYGGIAGFFGGRIDNIMMRLIEVISGIPFILYVILLLVVLGPGFLSIITALGISLWITMARIVRGEMLMLREQEYVLAAKTMGGGLIHILSRHLIPNAMGSIIVTVTFTVPEAIFSEAFLSFLGLGVSVPKASWGMIASEGVASIGIYPWQLLLPAGLITLTMLAFNFLGNGLREALDPRLGNKEA